MNTKGRLDRSFRLIHASGPADITRTVPDAGSKPHQPGKGVCLLNPTMDIRMNNKPAAALISAAAKNSRPGTRAIARSQAFWNSTLRKRLKYARELPRSNSQKRVGGR